MRQLVDEPWKTLTLDSVRHILDDAGDEGQLRQGERTGAGDRPVRKDHILRAVSGFANSSGGYVLL